MSFNSQLQLEVTTQTLSSNLRLGLNQNPLNEFRLFPPLQQCSTRTQVQVEINPNSNFGFGSQVEMCCFVHSSLSLESDFVWTSSSFVWRKHFCQCWVFVCLFVFQLGYFINFLCFEPPEAISSGLLLLCAEESILVYFWCLRCFILFFAFALEKRFRDFSPSFVLEEAFWLIIYFLCFEPPEAISSGLLLLLCSRKHFGLFLVFALFHSILFAFALEKRFRDFSPSFVLEEAFWLMLGTVFALFHSIFFAFATSIRISRVEVPPGLELGLARVSEPGVGVGVQLQP